MVLEEKEKEKGGIAILNKRSYRILLVREKNGKWGLPKGRIEKGDSGIFECASRELKEETGIDINKTEFHLRNHKRIAGTTIYFISLMKSVVSVDVNIDPSEISEYMWYNINYLKKTGSDRILFNKTIRDFVRYF